MAEKGADLLLYVNTGTTQSPVWTKVGGQKNATLSEERDTIEMTSKDNDGYRTFEPSLGAWAVSADGLYIADDAGYLALQEAMREGEKVKVQLWKGVSVFFEGLGVLTSSELEMPYDDGATYSVEIQGSGKPTGGDA